MNNKYQPNSNKNNEINNNTNKVKQYLNKSIYREIPNIKKIATTGAIKSIPINPTQPITIQKQTVPKINKNNTINERSTSYTRKTSRKKNPEREKR